MSVDAVHDKLICKEEIVVAVSPVGVVGGVTSPTVLLTVAVIVEDVVEFPAASRATAVSAWLPLLVSVVFHVVEYGLVMSSVFKFAPSSLNWTPVMPILSEAFAETVTAEPETVEPFVGAVIDTVGGVVSLAGAFVQSNLMFERLVCAEKFTL